jgi:hypothetical protein
MFVIACSGARPVANSPGANRTHGGCHESGSAFGSLSHLGGRRAATFAVVFDSTGATPGAYGAKAMPSSYLVDRDGRIAAVEYGFRETHVPALEAKIRALSDTR